MKISLILIPDDKDITSVLLSLKDQVMKDFELLIIDDKYNEDYERLKNIYSRYFDVKYIIAKNAKSISEKINVGLFNRKNEIIGFMYADTIYKSNTTQFVLNDLYGSQKQICVCNLENVEINKENIQDIVYSDNYFINYENNDIHLFSNEYETRVKDIVYIENLIRKGFNCRYVSSYKINSSYTNSNIENEEYGKYLKNEILKRKKINLIFRFIKNLFKGEK